MDKVHIRTAVAQVIGPSFQAKILASGLARDVEAAASR